MRYRIALTLVGGTTDWNLGPVFVCRTQYEGSTNLKGCKEAAEVNKCQNNRREERKKIMGMISELSETPRMLRSLGS